ncbi:hypothetical protein ACF064_34600 [Streptomyces sp. NPDC015492]|uniref:hypothetical protein n=1 Tax=Streptomyces sp. NPDC015492 TaxID=3364958 RepID=UPI0036FC4BBD
MGRIPTKVRAQIPGHDIVHAHRSPMFISTLTTGVAFGLGSLSGLEGTDALMAGILGLPSIPGIVSLGCWAAVALVPFKLCTVLRRKHPAQPPAAAPGPDGGVHPPTAHLAPLTPADELYQRWAQYISHPHINGSAIFNADPKGSSNPAIDRMAAYSGLGPDGAIGALRVGYALLQHRIAESARLGLKNFTATPERLWAPLILDEASKLLGETAEHKKEAVFIANAGATLGRSLGMPVILANQLMQLAQLGGDAAIRDNIFYGGSLILLRSGSQQKYPADLPENFAGCNPADIPAAWAEDRALIFDPTLPDNHPDRTFGLGFAASPGAHAEMMRNWLLEDATPYIDQAAIAHPADWPGWERRDEIARIPVIDAGKGTDPADLDGDFDVPAAAWTAPKKLASADDKIVAAFSDLADPLGLETAYIHKDQISALTRLEGSTLDNALSRLTKADRAHRQVKDGKVVRGHYGLGPAPTPDDSTDSD